MGGSILITSSGLSTLTSNLTAASTPGSAASALGSNSNSNNNNVNEAGRSVSAHGTQRNTAASVTKTCYLYSTLE